MHHLQTTVLKQPEAAAMLKPSETVAEGWGFVYTERVRGYTNRSEKPNNTGAARRGVAALALLLAAALGRPSPCEAEAPLSVLETILASPDFGGEEETWGIRPKEKKAAGALPRAPSAAWVELVKAMKKAAAIFLLTALGLGAAASCCALVYRSRRRPLIPPKPRGADHDAAHRAERAETPEYWLRRSQACFDAGEAREAWAACLRAWAAWISASPREKPRPGATEHDLLRAVREKREPAEQGELREESAEAFAEFLEKWLPFAYAGKPPAPEDFPPRLKRCERLVSGGVVRE
ncbi:MAG: hypothetical protein LBD24_00230 [Spirochaetaceae bacterium]|nr:hypothetical protein [Spirochaetaceae bacterium]